jgi:N-acetylmuramic acid 6-phosphate etherase
MTHLATPDAPLVWEAVTAALTAGVRATERHRVDLHDLDLRPTADLVRLINAEDRTVADAVADAVPAISAAIDAIVQRLESGGRLVYVGAGSSGRAATADAAESGPTFSTDRIVAVATDDEAAEDDT